MSLKQELDKRVERGLIKRREDTRTGYLIYNYSERCQYAGAWDEYTTMARGLILSPEGEIAARPFPKFFNLAEHVQKHGEVDEKPVRISEKLDGSLIVTCVHDGKHFVTTRGSFDSDQAKFAKNLLWPTDAKYEMEEGTTYLFELIHPWNRIVVDYGDREELVFLAAIDNATGDEIETPDFIRERFKVAQSYPVPDDLDELPVEENSEGYVLTFKSGLRLKVKHPEYVRLHKIIFGLNERQIWECLRDGKDPSENLDGVPDETFAWVEKVAREIKAKHEHLMARSKGCYDWIASELGDDASRKDYALKIQEYAPELQPLMFAMLSGKDYEAAAWKMVRPEPRSEVGSLVE